MSSDIKNQTPQVSQERDAPFYEKPVAVYERPSLVRELIQAFALPTAYTAQTDTVANSTAG